MLGSSWYSALFVRSPFVSIYVCWLFAAVWYWSVVVNLIISIIEFVGDLQLWLYPGHLGSSGMMARNLSRLDLKTRVLHLVRFHT